MTSLSRPAVSLKLHFEMTSGRATRVWASTRLSGSANHFFSRHAHVFYAGVSRGVEQLPRNCVRLFSVSDQSHNDVAGNDTKNLLEATAEKARLLFSGDCSSEKTAANAAVVVRDLLDITSRTEHLLKEIEARGPDVCVTNLHRSLLGVASWCLKLSPQDDALLTLALALERRARELSLPFHMPLYQRLAVAVAGHYSGEKSRSSVILDVSNWANGALEPVKSSFFNEPLATLVRQNQLGEAIELLKGMHSEHNMDSIDYDATVEILDTLKMNANLEDDADAMELFLMLNKSLVHEPSGPVTSDQVESLEDTVASMVESERTLEEIMDLAERLASGDVEDDGTLAAAIDSILEFAKSPNNLKELAGALKDRIGEPSEASKNETVFQGVAQVDPKSGEILQLSYSADDPSSDCSSSDDEVHDLAKEIVYVRDATKWKLPDVADQLIELNGGKEVLYTSEYEEMILAGMAEEEEREEESDPFLL